MGRTGTVVGALLADQGLDYDTIIRTLRAFRAGTKKEHRPCPETEAQRGVLRRRASA
ncbi:hypothetical protein BH23ACT1_BH23ACT1_00070 [soil metagenome]